MNFTLYNTLSQALNWLIPMRCIVCDKALNDRCLRQRVCEHCYTDLPFQNQCCQRCGQHTAVNTDYCGRCIKTAPTFDKCLCPFKYESSIKELICELKYRERPELAKTVALLLSNELSKSNVERPDALIAVPMHISRLRTRGYNHSTLIAQHLSKVLNIPLIRGALIKHKRTAPQAQLSLNSRKKNLNKSFKLEKTITAKSVAIIDDVVTTGATAEEIAKILKKNGVDYIQVWGVAHTL